MKLLKVWALVPFLVLGWRCADAVPDLGDILGNPLYAGVVDNGVEIFSISDTDGTDDDITGLLVLENAAFAGVNRSFIYDLDDPTNQLTIFDGAATVFDSVVLTFAGGMWDNGADMATFGSGAEFGIGLDSGSGDTWYSQNALNTDGFDHLLVFDTEGLPGIAGAFEGIVAWEDLPFGGDEDYTDHVIAGTDLVVIQQQIVPAPGPLLLVGLSLLALAGIGVHRRG